MPCRCRDRRPWAWVSLPGPSTRVMLFPWPQFYNMSNGVSKSSSLKPSEIRSWITCVTPCLEAAPGACIRHTNHPLTTSNFRPRLRGVGPNEKGDLMDNRKLAWVPPSCRSVHPVGIGKRLGSASAICTNRFQGILADPPY